MDTKSQLEDQSAQNDLEAPITLKDVARAVFLAPQETTDQVTFSDIKRSNILKRIGLDSPNTALPDLADLNEPTIQTYEHTPIAQLAGTSSGRIVAIGLGGVAAILFAYLAQSTLAANAQTATFSVILYLLAGALWVGLLAFEIAPPDGGLLRRGAQITGGGAARPLAAGQDRLAALTRALLVAMSLSLSAATYVFTADNTLTLSGAACWLLSVLGWLLVVAEREPEKLMDGMIRRAKLLRPAIWRWHINRQRILIAILVLGILGTAIFYRFYRLAEVPSEMTSDHVEKLLDAYDVSQGQFHIFFPRNGGREAIQMYLVALASNIFGTGMSHLTLKLVTALEALALVPLIVWLGRELVDWETGLFAAALLAISWWDTSLARLGLRIVLTPLVFTCLVIALARGIRTGSRKSWIWAGIWLGIGVYAYQAMRMAPFVAVAACAIAIAGPIIRAIQSGRKQSPDAPSHRLVAANIVAHQTTNLMACGVIALAFFVPMLRFWHDNPAALWNRVVNRTTSSEVAIVGSPAQVFFDNYQNALGMYNVRGDTAWISGLPGAPALDAITAGLLVLGLLAWFIRLRIRRDPVDMLFLVAGLIMLLPSALAIAFPIENPSLTRASGTLPIVMVLAAWPLALIRQRWHMVIGARIGNTLAAGLIAMLLIGAAAMNYQTYFIKFDASYRLSALNPSEVAHEVRQVIGQDGDQSGVWLIGWPYWHDYRAIGSDLGDITFHNAVLDFASLVTTYKDTPETFNARPLVFIIAEQDVNARTFLREQFPQGRLAHYIGLSEKHSFYLFIVEQK